MKVRLEAEERKVVSPLRGGGGSGGEGTGGPARPGLRDVVSEGRAEKPAGSTPCGDIL